LAGRVAVTDPVTAGLIPEAKVTIGVPSLKFPFPFINTKLPLVPAGTDPELAS